MNANNNGRTTKAVAGLLGRYNLKPLADWWAGQPAIEELMSLDDHTLKDILHRTLQNSRIVAGNVMPRRAANENLAQQSGTMRRQ